MVELSSILREPSDEFGLFLPFYFRVHFLKTAFDKIFTSCSTQDNLPIKLSKLLHQHSVTIFHKRRGSAIIEKRALLIRWKIAFSVCLCIFLHGCFQDLFLNYIIPTWS
ncbi:hypothetical protein COCNU_contig69138157G000010 [Cocos nucifera]|nr:hypothetical protein [Cocos nucifera]